MSQRNLVSRDGRAASGKRAALALVVLGGLAACDGAGTTGPVDPAGNVEYRVGAEVTQTDTAVVVDGSSILRFPHSPTVRVERFHTFDFGGFPELGFPQPGRESLAWRVGMSHQHPPVERGDSTIYSFVDYGEATVAGAAMDRLTQLPHVMEGTPVRFENLVSYLSMAYAHRQEMTGESIAFTRAPYFDDMIAGAPLALEITGSEEVEPASGSFRVHPFATLVGLANGSPLPLDGAMPEVNVNRPLVLTFDRALDPGHAYIVIYPFGPPPREGRWAWVQPRSATHEVVVPAELLRDLVAGANASRLPYRLTIQELRVGDPVLTARFRDGSGEVGVPFVQQSQATLHLRLVR
jgi:hypothetical protein